MRIAHVITKGDVGGAQTHVVELASAQLGKGDVVSIVAGSDGPAMQRARRNGVHVVIEPGLLTARSRIWHRPALRELRAALRRLDPELVHGHSSNGGLLARLAGRLDGYPTVYTAHGWPFQSGAASRQRALSFVAESVGGRLGDAVICLTEAEAQRARKAHIARRERLWVIPNGLADVEPAWRKTYDAPEDDGNVVAERLSLVMVARFAPPKMHRELFEALSTIADGSWELTLIGDGPDLPEITALGQRLLGDAVVFAGHRDDVEAQLVRYDVALLWSRYEGMPIALLEAMRAGLCCIASDLPGVRELFGEVPAGLIAADEHQLVAMISDVRDDPTRRRALSASARARYEQSFSLDAMEAATREVYGAVLERRDRPTRRFRGPIGHRRPRDGAV